MKKILWILIGILLLGSVMGLDSITFYTHTDGYISHINYNETLLDSWDRSRNATTGTAIDTTNTLLAQTNVYVNSYNNTVIRRVFLSFNTSSIPDGAINITGKIAVYKGNVFSGDNDGNDFLVVTENTQASDTSLSTADYDQAGGIVSVTELSNRIDLSSGTGAGYNEFTLNSDGLDDIDVTGFSTFAIREGHDVLNDIIDTAQNWMDFDGSEDTDPPRLIVYYYVDSTAPTFDQTPSNQTIEYGDAFNMQLNATDSDGEIDTWKVNDTTNFQINSTGYLENKTQIPVGQHILTVTVNNTYSIENSTVFTITVQDTSNPTWNQTPSNQEIDYPNDFSYQVNATDLSPLSTYFIDDTTNFTIDSTTGIIINNTLLIGNTIYGLNISINDTSGNILSKLINITVNDITNPEVYVIAPTGTYTSATGVPLTGNSSDNIELDSCWYNITNDAGVLEKANTDLTNCINISTSFSIGGGNDDYILYLYVNDTTGNINSSAHTFTINVAPVIPPAPSGGGGSISVDQNYTFAIVVWNYFAIESKQVGIKPAQTREYCLDLISTNTEESQEVELFCELPLDPIRNDICDWITLDRTKVTLQPTEEIREKVCLTITTPEGIVLGDQFLFSIKGKSDLEESQEFLHPITLWVTDYSQFIKNYGEILTSDTLMQSTYDFIRENIKDDITELDFTWSNFWFPLILFNQIILFIVFLTLTKNPITILISQVLIYMIIGVASMFYGEVMIVVTVLSLITLIFVRLWKK